ncbi:MAG: GlcNAc-PI de-N-acetylase [Cellulomonadaceae bacterium]|nr:GlcNAc-PI de-N-acetylase [Cellulomonadaceae bacterium]
MTDAGVRGGLLAVHAHPDDETLSTGALLATWAASGRPVTLVTCTRGEQGEVIGPLAHLQGDGGRLAAHRERELAAATGALGVRDHVFLDELPTGDPEPAARYADSGMAWVGTGEAGAVVDLPPDAFVAADLETAARRLAALVRDKRPDVVVGYEPRGGYGHPDHVRAHEVMMRAVELAAASPGRTGPVGSGDETVSSAGGAWDVPVVLWAAADEQELRDGYRAAAQWVEADLVAPDPDGALPSCAVPTTDLKVEVGPVLDAVVGALTAHATQVRALRRHPGAVPASFALSNAVLQPVLAHEAYVVARGSVGTVVWPSGVRVA